MAELYVTSTLSGFSMYGEARLGVSGSPLPRKSAVLLPKAGGMRALFLLLSTMASLNPSSSTVTAMDVGSPITKGDDDSTVYSAANALEASIAAKANDIGMVLLIISIHRLFYAPFCI